jgi:hypothetical protein
MDGLEAGLADRLQLLTGGRRVDSRHRSLRSMLDWSCALLDEQAQAVLRRVAVFAGAFRAEDEAAVVGSPPVATREIGVHLAALADHSLLVPTTATDGTRYRALEAVRQPCASTAPSFSRTPGSSSRPGRDICGGRRTRARLCWLSPTWTASGGARASTGSVTSRRPRWPRTCST